MTLYSEIWTVGGLWAITEMLGPLSIYNIHFGHFSGEVFYLQLEGQDGFRIFTLRMLCRILK